MNRINLVTCTIVSLLVGFMSLYIIELIFLYDTYAFIRNENALAMVNLLFPNFNILIVCYLVICLFLYSKVNIKIIHVSLLVQLGIMLWLTPYFLSGFSRYSDALWHIGVSKYIPEVLHNLPKAFTEYGSEYPGSFILNFVLIKICGIDDIFLFSRVIYPLLSTSTIILLFYTFFLIISNMSSAFISTTLTIIGLYYLELYPSPHSFGTILGLCALILLVKGKRLRLSLFLFLMTILVVSHPLTPVILILFMISLYISKRTLKLLPLSLYSSLLPLTLVMIEWLGWAFLHSLKYGGFPIALSILRIFSRGTTITEVVTPMRSIFPEFPFLRLISFLSYIIVFGVFIILLLRKKRKWELQQRLLFTMALFALILSILFGLSVSSYTRERGLSFFLLMVSGFIGFNLYSPSLIYKQKTKIRTITALWILLLTFVYPSIAYYNDAINSIPFSEGSALTFLGTFVNLTDKGISMSIYHNYELSPFIGPLANLYERPFPPRLNDVYTDVVLFRKTTYFGISMKVDFTFANNSYIQAYNLVMNSCAFNKIFDNPTSELFIRPKP